MSTSHQTPSSLSETDLVELAKTIKDWGTSLGFSHTAISDVDLSECEDQFIAWLDKGFQGQMDYLSRHGTKRTRPAELVPGTVRVITVRIDYLNQSMTEATKTLNDPEKGYVSRYALGRDYHKVIRNRLQSLAESISAVYGEHGYRAFSDSAPVMEKALSVKSGHGWMGKHTNLINQSDGSWFFLGELYTNIPLPTDAATTSHCGSCKACIDICPTAAIVEPYVLDARRCISYLTIELKESIPVEFREAIGNRIYGCDDCQLVCPWNQYANISVEPDFQTRHELDDTGLIELFGWSESDFLTRTEGSAIRRIGYNRWIRNIAIGLGNAKGSDETITALKSKIDYPEDMVREHIIWAISQQEKKRRLDKHSISSTSNNNDDDPQRLPVKTYSQKKNDTT